VENIPHCGGGGVDDAHGDSGGVGVIGT